MATVPINFVDYGARCDALCRNNNVDRIVYSGRDSAQDEIISRLILPVSLETRFPCSDFHGLTSLTRTTHHGRESGVGLFLVSSVAPLSMGHPKKCDFFWTLCQRIGATCHGLIGKKSCRFTWPRNMPRVSYSFVCVVSDVRAHCL